MSRRWRGVAWRVLVVIIAAGGAMMALNAAQAKAPSPKRFISPRGDDRGDCQNRRRPCRTVAYAFTHSRAGQIVQVAGGRYGRQTVPPVPGRGGPAVQFQAADGARVHFGGLDVRGSHVTFSGIRTGDIDIERPGATVEDVTIIGGSGRRVWMKAVRDVALLGGSYGGTRDNPVIQIAGTPASSRVTLDSVDVHDAAASNAEVHTECFWAGGVQGLTVRNSRFSKCSYFDIFFTTFEGPNPAHVLLENNVFERTVQWNGQPAPYALNVANWVTHAENFVFRHNTLQGDVAIQSASMNGFKVISNIGESLNCVSGVEYQDNVWTRARCGPGDRRVPNALSQFVAPDRHDWRLRAGADAIDAGDDGARTARDAVGLLRVGAPDAGAHEYQGRTPEPGGGNSKGPRLMSTRVGAKRVCIDTKGCSARTRLTVTSGSAALATIRIESVTLREPVGAGERTFVLDARRLGLSRGSRRVTVWLTDRDGRTSKVARHEFQVD